MADDNLPVCTLFPLSSDEPLFEWDIVTDALFMSHSIARALHLETPLKTMADFYRLLPSDAATELMAMRGNILRGQIGASPECSYLCNGFWVREYMMVLARNSEGCATRVMGKMNIERVSPAQAGLGFNGGMRDMRGGVWIYDVKNGKVWRDKYCDTLLGRPEEQKYPLDISQTLQDVHPAERAALQRHYKIFCESGFFGDTITDLVRIKMADGTYAPLLVRASAVERGESGKATLIAGLITAGEQTLAQKSPFKDDNLFHALCSMGGGQWNWDTKTDLVSFCPRYLEMLGFPPDAGPVRSGKWRERIHPEDHDKVVAAQECIIESQDMGDTFECTYRMRAASGEWAWIFDRGCVAWRDESGRASHIIGSITNITTAQAERDRLEDLVRHDTLTGLRSRAFCNLEIKHIEQNGIRPVCVISADVTGLKMINDSLGHTMGDALLTRAASLLRACLRKTDCVGRIGGDEFLVLLPNCSLEKGKKLVRNIKNQLAEYNALPAVMPVFLAVGLAFGARGDESLAEIIDRADGAMYEDKKCQRENARLVLCKWIREKTGRSPVADDRLGGEETMAGDDLLNPGGNLE